MMLQGRPGKQVVAWGVKHGIPAPILRLSTPIVIKNIVWEVDWAFRGRSAFAHEGLTAVPRALPVYLCETIATPMPW